MKPNLKLLESQIDEALAEVCRAVRDFAWEDRKAYSAWVAQTYYFVRHSTNLLALKAAKYPPEEPEKHQAALTHLRDESGHDKMCLRDLKALGTTLSAIPEQLEIALFYQSQYYWLTQHGPLSFTGYTLLLEELANREGASIAKRITEAHGREACSFVLLHAKADIEHTEMQRKEFIGAREEQLDAMMRNMRQSARLYATMLRNIMASVRAETRSESKGKPRLKIAA